MLPCLLLFALSVDPLTADAPVVQRGTIKIGPSLTQQFQLTNAGSQTITILDVRSSCGCLAPKIEKRELAPGQKTNLQVEVNTLSQPAGPINWATQVNYRHGDESKRLTLELRAHLVSEIKVEPASVAFAIRQTRSIDVTIQDTRSKPFRITSVGTSLSNVKAEIVGSDGPRQLLRLTASADGPTGVQSAFAWFTTNDPEYPQIKIPVTVNISAKQRIVASPSVIDIAAGGTARILVRDQDGYPVTIDLCAVDGPLTTSIISNSPAAAIVSLRCVKDAKPSDATLYIKVLEPVPQVIAVPVIVR